MKDPHRRDLKTRTSAPQLVGSYVKRWQEIELDAAR